MVVKVAVPQQFKLKIIPDFKSLFFTNQKEIHYIGGSEVLPAPLEAERETEIIEKLGTEYDEEAKKTLIEHNLRLVVYIAKKFDNTGVGVEDLISIGTIGLIKAIHTFNPDKKIKLATYASRCIENEILMFLRNALVYRTRKHLPPKLSQETCLLCRRHTSIALSRCNVHNPDNPL